MSMNNIAVIILAAGQGTRMKSTTPKVLHPIAGKPMIGHVLDAAGALNPAVTALVVGASAENIAESAAANATGEIEIAVQDPPLGTAHAVAQAISSLKRFDGAVLVLYADTPLVRPATLRALADQIAQGATVAALGFTPQAPGAYGRLKRDKNGGLAAIIEAKDANEEELAITLCNSGVMAIAASFLKTRLKAIDNKNAKGEYYLTDIVALARADGKICTVVEADADEVLGVNSRSELAQAETIFQNRMRLAAMHEGATLLDPSTVYFSHDTVLGRDVIVGQHVVFGPGVTIRDRVEIKPFSHLEGALVECGAVVGPYARLRPGAHLNENVKVGNFVEIKNAEIGAGAKINHLSYIGDAAIGDAANIGAGAITCNYDGHAKHKTEIGKGAFIGSNASLVAPVVIGDGAYVGSGSVITRDVEPNALAVARGRQSVINNWAARFRSIAGKKTQEQK